MADYSDLFVEGKPIFCFFYVVFLQIFLIMLNLALSMKYLSKYINMIELPLIGESNGKTKNHRTDTTSKKDL